MKNTQDADAVRWPAMIIDRIAYLARNVATADFRPNDQQREVQVVLRERLRDALDELEVMMQTDLPEFNRLLERRSVPRIITQ
jgi:hypothetical protein